MDLPLSHDKSFHPGDQVRITDGTFSGLTGTLVDKPGIRPKALMRISLFGRQTHVDVGLWQLEKVE